MVNTYLIENRKQKLENSLAGSENARGIIRKNILPRSDYHIQVINELYGIDNSRVEVSSYESIAKQRSVGKLKKDNFLLMDGVICFNDSSLHGKKGKIFIDLKPAQRMPRDISQLSDIDVEIDSSYLGIKARQNQVGTFDLNGGIIAFVDEFGDLYAAPANPSLINRLKAANYQHSREGIPVPLSTFGKIADYNLRKKWSQDANRLYRINCKEEK